MMVFVCLMLFGALSTRMIPLELYPEFDVPMVFVRLPYPGSTPEEVEREITRPAEEALATLTDVQSMSSTSYENRAEVRLEFAFGTDTDLKAIEVREKLDGIQNQLPRDMERVFVGQFSTSDIPILQLRVSSERDLSGAYELLDRKLKRPIERLEGVSQVELQGVAPREVRIELNADRVAAHQVDLVSLSTTLQRSDLSASAGRVTDGGSRYVVRPVGQLNTLDAIRNLVVTDAGVRLQDIATVDLMQPELDHGRHLNRTYAVGLSVSKEAGANTVEVSERVEAVLAELEGDPEMRGISVYIMQNSAESITSSLRDLLEAGFLGGIFALIVLYLFLRRLSTTLIVSLAVPISVLVTIGALYFLGFSLNVLSLMGLMLAVGMLVDNAVVVTENIHRHQRKTPDDRRGATLRAVKEVGLAVTAGTLTTAIVFLPMIVSQSDQVTLFLKHVSVAICVALGVSLAISLTVVPLLTVRVSPPKDTDEPGWLTWLIDRYGQLLDAFLRRKGVAALSVLGLLLSVAIPGALVSQDFFPNDNTARELRLHFHVNDTYTVERVEDAVDRVEEYLFAQQDTLEIESVYSYYRADYAQSTILLTEEGDRALEDLEDQILAELPRLTVADPSFTWDSDQSDNTLRLTLSGPSSEVLGDLSRDVERVLQGIPSIEEARSQATRGEKEVRVVVDRERARQYGFSSTQVAQTVASAMRGQPLRRFRTASGEVEMRLQFEESDRQSIDQLRSLPLRRPQGGDAMQAVSDAGQIPLGALADLRVARGPQSISRENRTTMVGVTVNYGDLDQSDAKERIDAALANVRMPTGYDWGYGQNVQREEQSQNVMMMNLLLALALIYLVMAALFESLIHPAAIWTSILFAVVGVFWFFLMTNTTFSIMAWIGVLVLIGVVVNNAIVFIDHINTLRDEGLTRHRAIVQAGQERQIGRAHV